jgi:hypothetical protein
MGFQFKNIETNYTYTLNEIDVICANFWGKAVHPKEYAYPGEPKDRWIHAPNWFDMLGHPIEDLQFFTYKDSEGRLIYKRSNKPRDAEFDMVEVASLMLNENTRYSESIEAMFATVEFLKPYVELCYHLKSLNIVGVGCGW